jgi:hypothetical protein
MSRLSAKSQDLQQIAHNSQEVLVQAKAVFPFMLFPDVLTVDRVKVTVKRHKFFGVSDEISTQIQDVLNVEADVGPFFGSLKMWTRFFNSEPLEINFLTRQDALDVRHILQGYVIARQEEYDCDSLDKDELVPLLTKLGHQPESTV